MDRRDELIECLEGEIAKRDAVIIELRKIAIRERMFRIEEIYSSPEISDSISNLDNEIDKLYAAPVSEAKAQDVVMPERLTYSQGDRRYVNGWNDALSQVNAAPVQQVSLPDGWQKVINYLSQSLREASGGIVPCGEEAIIECISILEFAAAQAAPSPAEHAWEHQWQLIHDTLRNYRMGTLSDGEGGGYPLIDAMTADGQSVSGGIEECTYLADALWNALAAAPATPAADAGLVEALEDMVAMMESDDEPGCGSEWYKKARAALAANSAKGVV